MQETMSESILLISASLFLCFVIANSGRSYSAGGPRERFERRFRDTCMKYDFARKYIDSIRHPHGDYLIFVFHEAGQKAHGGLGDRVAGMITALAYAIRTKRTFLVQGDAAFEDAFRPYYPSTGSPQLGSGVLASELSWKSWDWANWSREYSGNMTKLHCINPRPQEKYCALDGDYYGKYKVLKYYGNRSYLCRWAIKPSLGIQDEVARVLNMSAGADLYEIAGCLLRLAMWPTEHLWKALDESLEAQFVDSSASKNANTAITAARAVHTTHQIGFHFRCGDSSFTAAKGAAINPECYFDTSGMIPWKGTGFGDDHSLDSPIDAAKCGKQLISQLQQQQQDIHQQQKSSVSPSHNIHTKQGILAYIASDNPDSSRQVNETLAWPFTIKPPQACHMDISASQHCTLTTSLHWFMLSLSDTVIMQALIKPPASVYSNGPETAHIHDDEPAPISAFSRYAAIYSLSKNAIRYGAGCRTANTTLLSYQTHGNWVCDPQMFY